MHALLGMRAEATSQFSGYRWAGPVWTGAPGDPINTSNLSTDFGNGDGPRI
jgi:hypothetical protein